MRLPPRQCVRLKAAVTRHFGVDARLWLFGSRVDEHRRGGDFDVYLQISCSDPDQLIERELKSLSELHASLGFEGEKIDLVIKPLAEWSVDLPIHQTAEGSGLSYDARRNKRAPPCQSVNCMPTSSKRRLWSWGIYASRRTR